MPAGTETRDMRREEYSQISLGLQEALLDSLGISLSGPTADSGLAVFLGRLEALLGVRRALWIEATGGGGRSWGSRGQVLERGGIDPLFWEHLEPGEVRRLSPDRLSRSVRRARSDFLALTLIRTPGSIEETRFLWLEFEVPLERTAALPDDLLGKAAQSAEHLFGLDRLKGILRSEHALKERGITALAMVHDLRHQLSLGLLNAQRARELEDHAASSELVEIERALSNAQTISRDALGAEDSRAAEASTFSLRDLLQQEASAVGRLGRSEAGLANSVAIALRCSRKIQLATSRSMLSRLVRNLLLNAYKASEEGGRVLLSAELRGERALIRVEDFGCGMDREKVRGLFLSDRTEAGGAGCGTLSILACVEALDAELEVESAVGAGTRVGVALSARSSEVETETRILLVDDHSRRRHERAKALESAGQRVIQADSARAALRQLANGRVSEARIARGLPAAELGEFVARARELGCEVSVLGFRETGSRDAT